LAAARSRYLGEGDDEGEAKEAVERVPLPFARLRAGDKLMSNIVTEGDQLILAAGIELNQALLEKLRNLHKVRRLREPIYVARPMVAEPARDQTAEERPAEDQTAQDQPANLQPAKAASA
jgi:hypothetical protein